MQNKPGFSLLEVVLGLAIGSMIFVTVMQTLSQLGFTLSSTVTMTHAQMSGMVGLRVLEADLSSMSMPQHIHQLEETNKKDTNKKSEAASAEKKEDKKEFFKKGCFIKHSGDNLESCTFISMYTVSPDFIVPKKVFYTLEEDMNVSLKNVRRYILYRQESLDYRAEKPKPTDKKYMVMRDIISLQLTAWAPKKAPVKDSKKDDKKNDADNKKEEEVATSKKSEKKESKKEKQKALISAKEWDSDIHLKEMEEKEHFPLLPHFIDITLIIAQEDKREVTYTTTIMTPAGFPILTLTGITPVQHPKQDKDKKDPHAQLANLPKEQELGASINAKLDKHFSAKLNPQTGKK